MEILRKVHKGAFDTDDKGYLSAVISTFDIIDRDGDMIAPSAVKDGTPIRLCSWGHKWGELPVGKGILKNNGKELIFEGSFFLNTEAGRETYETVKSLGDLGEWSWGFSPLEDGIEIKTIKGKKVKYFTSVEAFEVSPVLVGANQETRTIDIKSVDETQEEVVEKTLVIAIEEKSDDELLLEIEEVIEIKCLNPDCACVDPDCVCEDGICTETKAMDEKTQVDTTVTTLSKQVVDLLKQLAILFLQKENMDSYKLSEILSSITTINYIISEEAWDAAMNTMESMKEKKNSIIKSYSTMLYDIINERYTEEIAIDREEKNIRYAEQGELLLKSIFNYVGRSRSLADLRAKEGRELSDTNRKRLTSLLDSLKTATSDIEDLLINTQQIIVTEEEQIDETKSETPEEIEETIVINNTKNRFSKLDRLISKIEG